MVGVKSIFHITCPHFKSNETSGKTIGKIVTNCLNELTRMNYTSIAIPSIGAGGLAHPAQLVAKSTLASIVSFLNLNRKKKLNVNIVIYENDIEIFQVWNFYDSLKKIQLKLNLNLS